MAGTYIEGSSKPLSGVYTLIKAALERVTQGDRGIVSYPFNADWGPVNELKTIVTAPEFTSKYNATAAGFTAAKILTHAFKGKPQRVLAYRMATAAAATGLLVLNDAVAAKSIELETLYPTTRAFTVVVKDGLVEGTKTIEIVEAGKKLLSVTGSTVAELIAKLNLSDYVRVKSSGAELPTNNAGAAFVGGNNGEIVTATEYAAYLDVLEADRTPSAISLDAVSDDAILATVRAWVTRVRAEGFYVTFAQGGPTGWDSDLDAANVASKAANYRGILNVGNGCDGYTAAEMAIFIAARAASVPLNRTLTDELVPYIVVNKKLKPGERVTAKEAGTLVFIMDGDAVYIDEGINTLTTPGADETIEFSKIRVANALDHIARDLEKFGNEYKKTRSNTNPARQTYAAAVETSYLRPLETMEVIQPGYFYRPDPEYHGKDAVYVAKIDEAFFYSDITPVDSMERIYQKINVKF